MFSFLGSFLGVYVPNSSLSSSFSPRSFLFFFSGLRLISTKAPLKSIRSLPIVSIKMLVMEIAFAIGLPNFVKIVHVELN
jgi:hypothetical protein